MSPGRPNPFRSEVELRLSLPRASAVVADVHDLLGRKVATLMQGDHPAGVHSIRWDRRTSNGTIARGGIYLVRVRAVAYKAERKVILLP